MSKAVGAPGCDQPLSCLVVLAVMFQVCVGGGGGGGRRGEPPSHRVCMSAGQLFRSGIMRLGDGPLIPSPAWPALHTSTHPHPPSPQVDPDMVGNNTALDDIWAIMPYAGGVSALGRGGGERQGS